eukprot:gene11963-13203_t
MPAVEMMHETIWFEQPKFEEAEYNYQIFLARKNKPCGKEQASSIGASSLIEEIEKARKNIKESLHEAPASSEKSAAYLEKENKELRKRNVERVEIAEFDTIQDITDS